jgi:hypothetical protein
VSGAVIELESLLGGFVADRTRLCDIMFPDGDTTTLELDWEEEWLFPSFELAEVVGDGALASVGVGGVRIVVGASREFGGVAGICVMIRFGPTERREVVDCVSSPICIWGGEAYKGSSNTLVSRFFPPNRAPSLPSTSSLVFGVVGLRTGAKASFSLPTGDGDTPRLLAGVSIVFACRTAPSSADVTESTRVASVAEPTESIVSEAIKGEDRVKSPACDW